MARLKPETAWRRIAENEKFPAKARLLALEQIPRPSLNLLRRLLSAEKTPRRLRLLAAQKYSLAIARRDLLKNARPTES